MTPADSAKDLAALIQKSIARADELKAALLSEQEALAASDADALQDAGIEKRRIVRELETLESARTHAARRGGFDTAPAAMADIARCLPDASLAEAWDAYLQIAKECSDLNARNGAVINMRRSQIHQTLSLLRHGQAESGTYGPAGQAPNTLGSRSLTEA